MEMYNIPVTTTTTYSPLTFKQMGFFLFFSLQRGAKYNENRVTVPRTLGFIKLTLILVGGLTCFI